MGARGSKSGVKNETPKLPEPREYLGEIGIFLLLNSDFPHTKFDFLQQLFNFREIRENLLQWLSDFFNGFPLSSTAFRFLQQLSDFPQMLSNFPQRLSPFQEIRENLFTAASIQKDHYLSFVFPATCSPSFIIPVN
jgi:hypothetical protein